MWTLAQEPLSSKINTCAFITIFYAPKKKNSNIVTDIFIYLNIMGTRII